MPDPVGPSFEYVNDGSQRIQGTQDAARGNPLNVRLVEQQFYAHLWADGAIPRDMRLFRDVEVEVVGVPTSPIIIGRSMIENGSYPAARGYDSKQLVVDSITQPGTYNFQGFGLFKFTGGGSAAVYIRGSN